MSNWIYGKDLIGHWDIEDFELFGFLKKGLQPYDKHGRKFIDSDSLKWDRKWTPEHCEDLVRGQETGIVMTNSGPLVSHRLTEQKIKQQGKELFEGQPLEILNPPKDSPYMSFSLPFNEKEATKAIASAKYFRFKKEEVSEFAEKQGLPRFDQAISDHTSAEEPNKKEAVETSPEKSVLPNDYDAIIKDFKLSYENDSAVNVKQRGRKAVTLEFKKRKKIWRDFIQILQEPEHTYYVGAPYVGDSKQENPQYSRRQKRMSEISKVLTAFFNERFSLHLAENFNFFKLCQNEKSGTYKLKCPVINADGDKSLFASWPEKKLIAELEKLAKEYHEREDTGIKDRFSEVATVMLDKKYITNKEIEDLITPSKEDIRYDPYENEPIKERPY